MNINYSMYHILILIFIQIENYVRLNIGIYFSIRKSYLLKSSASNRRPFFRICSSRSVAQKSGTKIDI